MFNCLLSELMSGKQLRDGRDGQLISPHFSCAGLS